MILPKVPVCQALKEKIKSTIERSSRRVAEQFRYAVLDRPKLQNLKMLKAKEKKTKNADFEKLQVEPTVAIHGP
ncbi:hypothetical protein MTR67_018505 [Solanum verrucosum]|uniref:Uncharacterized protein n=1 Tax=Solanum verrucosum TaxID=315347 RepID=A0AAF0TT37_SOLVR|nr:hypothetical protein MTR67_018505 [Solanum verrucosum]